MPIEIAVYDGAELVKTVSLLGDVDTYDIIIKTTDEVKYPPERKEGEPPDVPKIAFESIDKDNNRNAYRRMVESPGSQPAEVRRFIYRCQMLTRKQIDAWAEEKGYSSHGGGIQTALIVLDNITGEINRLGEENEDQRIVWTGGE